MFNIFYVSNFEKDYAMTLNESSTAATTRDKKQNILPPSTPRLLMLIDSIHKTHILLAFQKGGGSH